MKHLLSIFLALCLVSCANIELTGTPVSVRTEPLPPTSTTTPSPIPSSTATALPLPTETPIPCDPFKVDFCITEGHFIFQRPIHAPGNARVDPTYRYASTANRTLEPHHGVEFPNPDGTPVHAAEDGVVFFAGPDQEAIFAPWPNFYGNVVVIHHDGGLYTLYAHLSKINVSAQQKVFAGDLIGEVGRTGGALGSHLHFEVRRGNVEDYFSTQNPELWLNPAMDSDGNPLGTLVISVVDERHTLVKHAEATVNYYPDQSQPPAAPYYVTSYSSDMLQSNENMVLGELPAGQYRIALKKDNQLYERWVQVESGKLTQVVFIVK